MENAFIYQQIADEVQEDILNGTYQPGDRLPSVRESTQRWDCTTGTVQHAFRLLAELGLVTGQTGKGTFVTGPSEKTNNHGINARKAQIIHRAEAFLLESLLSGYSLAEILESIDLAQERIQVKGGPSA